MKRIGFMISVFAVLLFTLPTLTAQDEKKKDDVKKDDVKKDETKKDDKKDPEKKDDEKKPEKKPAPEKFVHGGKILTKIISVGGNTTREFTVERHELDPKKQQDFNNWVVQRSAQLARQNIEANTQKDFKARLQAQANYQRALVEFNVEKTKRANNLTSVKPLELRAAENAKVRTNIPPVEFDDQGFQKKWTKKELEERKDKSGLPGFFAVDFDAIRQGQYVEIYFAKAAPKTPMKKKGPDDDDVPMMKDRQEFVLVVIVGDSGK